MRRRDLLLSSLVVILIAWSFFQQHKIRELNDEIGRWEDSRFEFTRVFADLQRRLFILSGNSGQASSLLWPGEDAVYKLNLLPLDQFEPTFLKYAEWLKLMAQSMQMPLSSAGDGVSVSENGAEDNFPDIWPTQGTITSLFGMRKHPIYKTDRFHSGVDIANFKNTEVLAAAAGTVKLAGPDGGYGNAVILDHGNGFESLYGHAEDILVRVGDSVRKGELIASMGSTGVTTGEHLHYEVRFAGEAVDPTVFVK